jgi:hypothetical protein
VNAAGNAFSITNTGGSAIEGITNAVSSNGIRGIATVNGSNGVYGGTTASNGVGVRGESNSGTGIVAYGGSGIGLSASSLSGTGIHTSSTSGIALNVNGNLKIAGGNTNPGAGKVLTSDANGNASWQVAANTPKVAFKAYGIAGGQAVVSDQTIKKVHFGGEKYDLGNTYNLLTPGATPTNESSTFTVPVTGLYHFDFSLILSQDGTNQETERAYVHMVIERNGQRVEYVASYGTRAYDYVNILHADDAIMYQQSSTEHLLAGDKVYIEVYHNTGSSATFLFTEFAWFNGHLVMTL